MAKDIIMGVHVLFARAGETIDGTVVGPEAKPDNNPTSNYTKVATVETWEPSIERETVKRRAPSPGKYKDRATLILDQTIEYAVALQEWSEMTMAEVLLGGNKPVGGVFVPGDRSELLTGWWIIQGYDQNDNLIVALNVWGEARIDSHQFGENLEPYALVITQLNSSLNTGEVSNLA